MPVVEHSAVVAVGIEDAFDLSQSYGLRLEWDPFVRAQSLQNGAVAAGKGVRTLTHTRHGFRMISEYITFQRPETVAMKMVEGPRMFDVFSGAWQFRRLADASTRVSFKYHFRCRPAWLAWFAHPIGRWFLGREIARRLAAFKRAAESAGMLERLHVERQGLGLSPAP